MSISKRGKKILVFTALVAALSAGVTIAYFRDTEESKDNLFRAGLIDIKLANTSYYNGELVEGGYDYSYVNISAIGNQYWDVSSQIRQFVAHPASNYGYMIMAGPSSSIIFRSREYTGTSYDPQLVITYGDYR